MQNSVKVKMSYYKYKYDKHQIPHDLYLLLKVVLVNREILNHFENQDFHVILSIKENVKDFEKIIF